MKYGVRALFLIVAAMGLCSCASLPSYDGYSSDSVDQSDARNRALAESSWRANFYGNGGGLNLQRMFSSPMP